MNLRPYRRFLAPAALTGAVLLFLIGTRSAPAATKPAEVPPPGPQPRAQQLATVNTMADATAKAAAARAYAPTTLAAYVRNFNTLQSLLDTYTALNPVPPEPGSELPARLRSLQLEMAKIRGEAQIRTDIKALREPFDVATVQRVIADLRAKDTKNQYAALRAILETAARMGRPPE